jgi:predicted ATPase
LPEFGAVRLFVERARMRLPDFGITSENARAVAEVCRRLEGIPLALELAAARMGGIAAEHLAERLKDSLTLLSSGPRTASPRHRTMRTTLEWSYELLSEEERATFRRLSVFAGGFALEAAEAVLPDEAVERSEILDLVLDLVEKSLLVAEGLRGPGEAPRYRMLEPVRHREARTMRGDRGVSATTRRVVSGVRRTRGTKVE